MWFKGASMFICAAVLAFLFQTTDNPNPNIWIENNEVWMRIAYQLCGL
jgi:hypothetical protein